MKKMRHCWNCGAELGEIEDRHYEKTDTCGARDCDRAARDMCQEEREERHREIDREYDDRW
jgi:hypothetical protein